ncbi:MAG TPA: hypothetical protein VNA69_05320 [Thermoanaerobaculia bacterium]|nr:hypothetical protein [Thermoanaerobaculia bacterium]
MQSIGGSTDAASKAPTEYHTTLQARANLSRIAALERPCRMDIRLLMMKAANERLLGRREEALATYRGILQFEPRPEVYLAGGRTLSEMGRFDEAIEWYLPAVRFNPALQLDIDNFGEELGRRVRARLAGGR